MIYIGIAIYIAAGILLICGVVQLFKAKKIMKFGKAIQATVQTCKTTGFGPIRKYWATVVYKVGNKKYHTPMHTDFMQILRERQSITIRYNPSNPEDIKPNGTDVYRVFFVLSAILVIIVNFLPIK